MLGKQGFGSEYGQSWAVAVTLLDGPKTFQEIIKNFKEVKRRLGFFDESTEYKKAFFLNTIKQLMNKGWIEKEDEHYYLTELGKKEAKKAYNEINGSREWIHNNLLNPTAVSKVTVIVHFVLALIKMPIGILSGSIGLLNDGVDTLLDGLSSVLVYFGIKYDFEKIVNYVLITIMFGTGFYTLYQAIRRFFVPVSKNIDWVSFTAVILSALISLLLMIYQRYVGVKRNNFTLITQSVDSKNHLIVAGGVMIGMVASLLNFMIIDIFVGLTVAGLILKGAYDLLIEILQNEEENSSYEMYSIGNNFSKERIKDWLLRKIAKKKISYNKLVNRVKKELDFEDNLTLKSIGLNQPNYDKKRIKSLLDKLIEEKYIEVSDDKLILTEKGYFRINNNSKFINFRNILNYFVIYPAGIITYLISYYIILGGLSLIPQYNLWLKFDENLFELAFPFFKLTYNFTVMNLIHLFIGLSIFSYAFYKFMGIMMLNHECRDPQTRKPLKLITKGYYSKLRHPMYGYMILINTSFTFALKSTIPILFTLLFTVLFLANGWFEEKRELIPLFEEKYIKYKQKVQRMYFDNKMIIILIFLYFMLVAGYILS